MSDMSAEVRALFEGTNIGHLATVLPDGSPHSVPLWVAMEGDRIAFLSSLSSRKARNIDDDARVAISVTDRERPNSMATVRGRVTAIVDGDAGWEIIDRLAQKYIGAPYPLRTDRVAFLIEPEHSLHISF